MVENLPTNAGEYQTRVQSLGREDPLEEGMATHSSIPAWRIPMHRGAQWPAVHGVTKNQTQLKRLSTLKKYTRGAMRK